jgi:hypothetical protein
MPNPAPGAERLAGGVKEDAAPAAPARLSPRVRRWAGVAVFLLVIVGLADAYLHLSMTYPENSDEANILLMANDMLHGNLLLHGWSVSDVPFITTELPQIALLIWIFGLHLNTAHAAAAVTYTLVVAVGMLLAKGKARGWKAVARMALVLGIMIAPQPGVGIFVAIFSVGHIGTALPVMLTWLVLDRLGRKWYVAALVAALLGWALTADPLVLVIAIYPLLAVCLARIASALAVGAKRGGVAGLRAAALDRWFEVWLAAAAGLGYLIAWGAGQFIDNSGGYHQQPVPYQFNWPQLYMQSQIALHGLLEMFGAYFVPRVPWVVASPTQAAVSAPPQAPSVDPFIPWPIPQAPLSGMDEAIALTHLVGVVFAVWGACAIARRFFFRDADFVSQLLLVGIVANIAAYVPSTLAHHSALNVREIAPVLPFAAVLAGRMIGDRLVGGPVLAIPLPAIGRPTRAPVAASGPAPENPAPRGVPRRHSLRIRLVAAPLVVLFGWYGFGLFRQADTPPAPEPLTNVAALLEKYHLSYGLGGYWEASILTVETDGKVTIRAITPACLQPYQWESNADWYNAAKHNANFILLSNVQGYFTGFAASGAGLTLLNTFSRPPYVNTKPSAFYHQRTNPPSTLPRQWPASLVTGGYYLQPGPEGPTVIWYYIARTYPINLLKQLPKLNQLLTSPPPWVKRLLTKDYGAAQMAEWYGQGQNPCS